MLLESLLAKWHYSYDILGKIISYWNKINGTIKTFSLQEEPTFLQNNIVCLIKILKNYFIHSFKGHLTSTYLVWKAVSWNKK